MFSRLAVRGLIKHTSKAPLMVQAPQRNFFEKMGLESTALTSTKSGEAVELWQEQVDNQNSLVLKSNDEIERYVLGICRDYFRTTKKASIALESSLKAHGLDSLDLIELVIQVEDDLGYVIDAENLELFQKPKHFVNFINQIEGYRSEFNQLPHENIKADFSLKAMFPQ